MICENIYVVHWQASEGEKEREACMHANKQISRKMSSDELHNAD